MKALLFLLYREIVNKTFRLQTLWNLVIYCAVNFYFLSNMNNDLVEIQTLEAILIAFSCSVITLIVIGFLYRKGNYTIDESDQLYLLMSVLSNKQINSYFVYKRVKPFMKSIMIFMVPLTAYLKNSLNIETLSILLIIISLSLMTIIYSTLINLIKNSSRAILLRINLLVTVLGFAFVIFFSLSNNQVIPVFSLLFVSMIYIITLNKYGNGVVFINNVTNQQGRQESSKVNESFSRNMAFKKMGVHNIFVYNLVSSYNKGKKQLVSIKLLLLLSLSCILTIGISQIRTQSGALIESEYISIMSILIASILCISFTSEDIAEELMNYHYRLIPYPFWQKYMSLTLITFIRSGLIGIATVITLIISSTITMFEALPIWLLFMSFILMESIIGNVLMLRLMPNFDKDSVAYLYLQLFITVFFCSMSVMIYLIVSNLFNSLVGSFIFTIIFNFVIVIALLWGLRRVIN